MTVKRIVVDIASDAVKDQASLIERITLQTIWTLASK